MNEVAFQRKAGQYQVQFESTRVAQKAVLWEAWLMPKRNLRIVKRVRNVPVRGICEYCNAEFSGDPNMGNAQSAIQEQFNAHKCKTLEARENATEVVTKTAKK
jgi:hypothetical protein